MQSRRRYSDRERAEALAALDSYNGNITVAAEKLGIPRKTLSNWSLGAAMTSDLQHMRETCRAELADRLEDLAHQLIGVMPSAMLDADLKALAIALGITVDKMQILRSKPSAIVQQAESLTDEERQERILAILAKAREREERGTSS